MKGVVTRVVKAARDFKGRFVKVPKMGDDQELTQDQLKQREEELDAREIAIIDREKAVKTREDEVGSLEHNKLSESPSEVNGDIHANDPNDESKGTHVARWTNGELPGRQRVKICIYPECGITEKV